MEHEGTFRRIARPRSPGSSSLLHSEPALLAHGPSKYGATGIDIMLSKTNRTAGAMLLAAIAATTVVLGQAGPQLGAPPSKSSKPTPYTLSGIYTLAGKA